MKSYRLPGAAHIGYAHLQVADTGRALALYRDLLGLRVMHSAGALTTLSADGARPHLLLTERPGAARRPARTTGLYHVAIRLPDRAQLGRVFRRLLSARCPFQGFSDHAVSEALYLADPDGNGLELYTDRPRAAWPLELNGQVSMTTEALDVENLLAAADDSTPWDGIHPATDIGHIHLHVADLERAEAFYHGLLGLDVMMDMRGYGALFLAAGGYHHHLGLNVWAGRGAPPPPPQAAGLLAFTLNLPDADSLGTLVECLTAAGVTLETHDKGVLARDPDGIAIALTVERVAAG